VQQQYGLIGQSLAHSFSKSFFTKLFFEKNIDAVYNNFNLANEMELLKFLQETECMFCNVTLPYKLMIKSYIPVVDKIANAIEAVNCIKKMDGIWHGTNTDVIGFEQSFAPHLQAYHTQAMIIGNGGAAQAVKYVLRKLNIPFVVVARTNAIGTINFVDLDDAVMDKYKIIINTTPLGMYPDMESAPPLPYHLLTSKHFLFDLIYNPAETKFLAAGNKVGATCINGLQMLELQAVAAWEWWGKE
jgi:shikimate dehydrogenase